MPAIPEQNRAIFALGVFLGDSHIIDRRSNPSHGYRAVHFIARVGGLPVEIQVRTRLQHQWAEISERLADRYGSEVKYGGGPKGIRDVLDRLAVVIDDHERQEVYREDVIASLPKTRRERKKMPATARARLKQAEENHVRLRRSIERALVGIREVLELES